MLPSGLPRVRHAVHTPGGGSIEYSKVEIPSILDDQGTDWLCVVLYIVLGNRGRMDAFSSMQLVVAQVTVAMHCTSVEDDP